MTGLKFLSSQNQAYGSVAGLLEGCYCVFSGNSIYGSRLVLKLQLRSYFMPVTWFQTQITALQQPI